MSQLDEKIHTLARLIVESNNIVISTGAGISTESGLLDYTGPDGVWTRKEQGLPRKAPTTTLDDVKPNRGHYALVELQKLGKLLFLISQNVDGVHLDSGIDPDKLAELHLKSEAFDTKTIELDDKIKELDEAIEASKKETK